jgi:hypothetical protein
MIAFPTGSICKTKNIFTTKNKKPNKYIFCDAVNGYFFIMKYMNTVMSKMIRPKDNQ